MEVHCGLWHIPCGAERVEMQVHVSIDSIKHDEFQLTTKM